MTFEKDFYPYQSLFNLLYPSEALTGDDTKDGDTFSKVGRTTLTPTSGAPARSSSPRAPTPK